MYLLVSNLYIYLLKKRGASVFLFVIALYKEVNNSMLLALVSRT